MLAFGFILPFLPLYLSDLGVRSERDILIWSGILVTSTAISLAMVSPLWGALADRHGRKVMVLRAMAVGGVIIALMGVVTNVWELLGLRVLQGAFTGTIAASTALVATIVPRDRLASSMGLLQTSVYLGISFGPVVGGLVAEAVGIRGTFFVGGALLCGGAVLIWMFVHEHFVPRMAASRQRNARNFWGHMVSSGLLPLLVALFLIQTSTAIVFPVLPLFVQQITPPDAPVKLYSGLAFGATAAFSALAAVSYSRILDRSGYRKLLIFACVAAAIFFGLQAFSNNVVQFLLLRAGLGLFFGVLVPATNAIVGLTTPSSTRGTAFGLTSSATASGNVIGPIIGSSIAASLGLPSIFLATAAVLIVLAVWVAALVPEPPAEAAAAAG
jgi:MFS transporter, DHA1 family, multidrug resistance protein